MNNAEKTWARLAAAARKAPGDAGAEAPYGFANRVAARWRELPRESWEEVWTFVARRALVGAFVVAAGTVAVHYSMLESLWDSLTMAGPMFDMLSSL